MDNKEKIAELQEQIKKLQEEDMNDNFKKQFKPLIKEVLEEIKTEKK
ncbi:unnamed protein product [marine sediment metagenome]|uniref:Uncharacterized protein n=1 Tax=marine sediment metagenome TaxID=412755 RepID=X1QU66_9ZZZZ